MAPRRLHLGAFMRPISIHTAAWRYPGAYPDANFNLSHLKRFARTLERGRFDAFFMADHLAVLNMPMDALKRSLAGEATTRPAAKTKAGKKGKKRVEGQREMLLPISGKRAKEEAKKEEPKKAEKPARAPARSRKAG